MKSQNPYRSGSPPHLTGAVAAGLMMLVATQTSATDKPGEAFVYDATETSGANVGETGMAYFTLGSENSIGFFAINSFAVSGFFHCVSPCTPLTENLSGVLFDPMTGGVVGDITGTFKGYRGGLHTFDLITTDLPAGDWSFNNTSASGTVTSMGIYKTTVATVDEPTELSLLIPAGVALLISLRRRRSTLVS
jgi:hypothetical protein